MINHDNPKRAFYRPDEIAIILQITKRTVYRMLRDGRLPGVKLGKNPWRIPYQSLVNLLGENYEF